jgi:hypothetical protein
MDALVPNGRLGAVTPVLQNVAVTVRDGRDRYALQEGARTRLPIAEARLGAEGRAVIVRISQQALLLAATASKAGDPVALGSSPGAASPPSVGRRPARAAASTAPTVDERRRLLDRFEQGRGSGARSKTFSAVA